ncbi:MAG: hypothetical protein ACJ79E_03730 [Anaeromyxobacteraceae bacterium]
MTLFARWHGAVLAVALAAALPSSALAREGASTAAKGYRHRPMCVSRTAPDSGSPSAVKSAATSLSAARSGSQQKPST